MRAFAGAVALFAVAATINVVQAAECRSAFGRASAADMDSFIAQPTSLMTASPEGGGLMVKQVRELLLANTDLTQSVLALAANANAEQRSSIGAALGQVTQACSKTSPDVAQQIQAAVLTVSNPEIMTAFRQATGDVSTAAVGIGAASSPAPAASPLGGTNASLIGGGVGEAGSGGVSQAGGGIPSSGFGGGGAGRSARAAFASLVGTTTTAVKPPVVTVPGPTAGAGFSGVVAIAFGLLLWRANRKRLASSGVA